MPGDTTGRNLETAMRCSIRSEFTANNTLSETARAPRLAPVDPAIVERARAAIRRHRMKRRIRAMLAGIVALASIFTCY